MGPAAPSCVSAPLVDEIGRLGPDLEVVWVDAEAIVARVAHDEPMSWHIARHSPGNQLVHLLAVSAPRDPFWFVVLA